MPSPTTFTGMSTYRTRTYIHSLFRPQRVCTFVYLYIFIICYCVLFFPCKYFSHLGNLFVSVPGFRLLHLRGLVIIAAQIGSRRVCLLLSEVCVQPDVSVTYFIIGSNQHQSPGRRGRCRWLLCARLPCLSERLCQVHVNLEKKGMAELPNRVNAALCSLQCLTPPYPSNKWSVKHDVSLCCTLCAEYITVSVCSPVYTHSAQMPSLCFARKKDFIYNESEILLQSILRWWSRWSIFQKTKCGCACTIKHLHYSPHINWYL